MLSNTGAPRSSLSGGEPLLSWPLGGAQPPWKRRQPRPWGCTRCCTGPALGRLREPPVQTGSGKEAAGGSWGGHTDKR